MLTALFVSFIVFVSYSYFVLVLCCNVGRLIVMNFSLVVPAIFDPLLHICIFSQQINDDDDDDSSKRLRPSRSIRQIPKYLKHPEEMCRPLWRLPITCSKVAFTSADRSTFIWKLKPVLLFPRERMERWRYSRPRSFYPVFR